MNYCGYHRKLVCVLLYESRLSCLRCTRTYCLLSKSVRTHFQTFRHSERLAMPSSDSPMGTFAKMFSHQEVLPSFQLQELFLILKTVAKLDCFLQSFYIWICLSTLSQVKVDGSVAEGLEPVKELFQEQFRKGEELSAQVGNHDGGNLKVQFKCSLSKYVLCSHVVLPLQGVFLQNFFNVFLLANLLPGVRLPERQEGRWLGRLQRWSSLHCWQSSGLYTLHCTVYSRNNNNECKICRWKKKHATTTTANSGTATTKWKET